MSDQHSYWWVIKFLIGRTLVVEAVLSPIYLFNPPRLDLLLLYASLLTCGLLLWAKFKQPRRMHLAGTGCLVLSLILPLVAILGCIAGVIAVLGLSGSWIGEHAWALFTLVLISGPLIYHWMIIEECYYQVYRSPKVERDLGFKHDTNTLEGNWPTGRKYLYLAHIQPGGLMDQAGFRPRDIVVDHSSFTAFWVRLEEARGGPPVSLNVVSWSDAGPVSKRPMRQLSMSVPRKNYSAALEKELGFRCQVKYFKENDEWTGVVIVTGLKPGGIMASAGFRDRDILRHIGPVPHFFEMLEQARGRAPVTLEVVPWIDPSDLVNRPVRELTLEVPKATAQKVRKHSWPELELQKDLGFTQGWERLCHRGKWHGWPTITSLLPDGILARAGFRNKDILLNDRAGFSCTIS